MGNVRCCMVSVVSSMVSICIAVSVNWVNIHLVIIVMIYVVVVIVMIYVVMVIVMINVVMVIMVSEMVIIMVFNVVMVIPVMSWFCYYWVTVNIMVRSGNNWVKMVLFNVFVLSGMSRFIMLSWSRVSVSWLSI